MTISKTYRFDLTIPAYADSRIRVRKKGQITLPQKLREEWHIIEGSFISLSAAENQAVIRPIKRTKIIEDAGALGPSDKDEIEFATMDLEFLVQYYSKKYKK